MTASVRRFNYLGQIAFLFILAPNFSGCKPADDKPAKVIPKDEPKNTVLVAPPAPPLAIAEPAPPSDTFEGEKISGLDERILLATAQELVEKRQWASAAQFQYWVVKR